MKIILDTEILSMFAKIASLGLLKELFEQAELAITPQIEEEISVPLEYGYNFPSKVISEIQTIPLGKKALTKYQQFLKKETGLGKGEIEAIAMCDEKGYTFATNDQIARNFAKERGVQVISLQAILRSLWKSGLKTRAEVKSILKDIEKVDNLEVSDEVKREIFEN